MESLRPKKLCMRCPPPSVEGTPVWGTPNSGQHCAMISGSSLRGLLQPQWCYEYTWLCRWRLSFKLKRLVGSGAGCHLSTFGVEKRLISLLQSAVVFPNKIHTEQQSLTLVKRLLAVAVSCITYLRGIFPESAYGTRYFDGNRLFSSCFA